MLTSDRSVATHKTTVAWFAGVAVALVVTLGLALVVGSTGHADTAVGTVAGGMLVVVLVAAARWRSISAPDRVGATTRIAGGRADERDLHVHQATLAVVGMVAIVLSGLASAATFVQVDAVAILRAMPFLLILTMLGAFVVVDRRS